MFNVMTKMLRPDTNDRCFEVDTTDVQIVALRVSELFGGVVLTSDTRYYEIEREGDLTTDEVTYLYMFEEDRNGRLMKVSVGFAWITR